MCYFPSVIICDINKDCDGFQLNLLGNDESNETNELIIE